MGIKTKCKADINQWHQWWAWHPVVLKCEVVGKRVCTTKAWWCYIERKAHESYGRFWWDYRQIDTKPGG